ncbi:uncharacterized protein IUM83_14597 [Phytophthora cinnamomi]|uniref:uncharacterized protein n=1 Tax=Phytophthora cinnamomi TaxID=4785 RepID=UPI00355A7F6F|nr:hypothetical protein IUM83_14597 [Phytophthora cinnamomi]
MQRRQRPAWRLRLTQQREGNASAAISSTPAVDGNTPAGNMAPGNTSKGASAPSDTSARAPPAQQPTSLDGQGAQPHREAGKGDSAGAGSASPAQGRPDASAQETTEEVVADIRAIIARAPAYNVPRHATIDDIHRLLYSGLLKYEEVHQPAFLRPELPPHWKLPSPPDPEGHAYLVGVPASISDVRNGAYTMDGYGGTTTLAHYTDTSNGVLRARRVALSAYELDGVLNSIGSRREFASILRHFNSSRLAERVFKTTGFLRRVLGSHRRLRKQVEDQGSSAIQDAIAARGKCEGLKREWKFTCDYWHRELEEALSKTTDLETQFQIELQTQKAKYQDEIDALETERASLKARLEDAETQARILK